MQEPYDLPGSSRCEKCGCEAFTPVRVERCHAVQELAELGRLDQHAAGDQGLCTLGVGITGSYRGASLYQHAAGDKGLAWPPPQVRHPLQMDHRA